MGRGEVTGCKDVSGVYDTEQNCLYIPHEACVNLSRKKRQSLLPPESDDESRTAQLGSSHKKRRNVYIIK